eukprot:4788252-Pleurochrysis_carterae.AAC.2
MPELGAPQFVRGTLPQVVNDLYTGDLISFEEKVELCREGGTLEVSNAEASRRIDHFVRSLSDPLLKDSLGVVRAPGYTVLVPHYGEQIFASEEMLVPKVKLVKSYSRYGSLPADASESKMQERETQDVYSSVMGFLVALHQEEWLNFTERVRMDEDKITSAMNRSDSHLSLQASTYGHTTQGDENYLESARSNDGSGGKSGDATPKALRID